MFLAQTDTTAGFLSNNFKKLNAIKNRPISQKILLEVSDLTALKSFQRIPNTHKRFVRKAQKTSFILPNGKSFRVIQDEQHLKFLRHFGALYSTSANKSGEDFDLEWAIQQCDIIVADSRWIEPKAPSQIYKLSKTKRKKIRG